MIKMLVLATAAAFAAVPAAAQEAPTSVEVAYGDLNLSTAQGSAALKSRIKAAARQICGVAQAPGLSELLPIKTCRAEVMSSAQPQIALAMSRGSGSVVLAASR